MGMGNAQNNNQVYFDPQKQQYYTFGMNNQATLGKNFIGGMANQMPAKQNSPINDLLAQSLAAKPNAPSLAQLFPGMFAPNMGGVNNMGGLFGNAMGQGQYGAGRFLAGNVMGSPGLTSNAMNTTT